MESIEKRLAGRSKRKHKDEWLGESGARSQCIYEPFSQEIVI